MFSKHREFFLMAISLLWAAGARAQQLIYVDGKRPPGGNGTSWCSAYPTLQEALDDPQLALGDEIWVARILLEDGSFGAYKPTVKYPNPNDTDESTKTFRVPAGIKIYGGFVGADPEYCADQEHSPDFAGESDLRERNPEVNVTILDGDIGVTGVAADNCYHVVYFQGSDPARVHETKLSGFTIRNGHADGSPSLGQDRGAGIYIIWGETATGPLLNRLVIENNYADHGGAGVLIAGKMTTYLTNCRIQTNIVDVGYGGGLLVDDLHADALLPVVMQNVLFLANEINEGSGAGASVPASGVKDVVNCTFYGNVCHAPHPDPAAYPVAGALLCPGLSGPNPRATAEINNCIVWANTAPQLGEAVAACYSDVEDASWWTGVGACGNDISLDPIFRSAPADLRLKP